MKVRTIVGSQEKRMTRVNVSVLLAFALLTAGCGGSGGGTASSSPASAPSQPASVPAPAPATTTPTVSASDLELAARIYKGDARTPDGFAVEARPANVMGTLSTRHLKNTDLATGPQAISPMYEVCTNDLAQAIAWSEKQATWQGQYSDLAEVHSGRAHVRAGARAARRRHRDDPSPRVPLRLPGSYRQRPARRGRRRRQHESAPR